MKLYCQSAKNIKPTRPDSGVNQATNEDGGIKKHQEFTSTKPTCILLVGRSLLRAHTESVAREERAATLLSHRFFVSVYWKCYSLGSSNIELVTLWAYAYFLPNLAKDLFDGQW